MFRIELILIFCIFFSPILAQKKDRDSTSIFSFISSTKRIIDKSNMPKYYEEFDVLVANDTVRHGQYKKISGRMYNKGEILEQGQYYAGKKVGFWKIGLKNVGYAQGNFQEGEKVGIWEYYEDRNKLNHKYDHTNHQVLFRSEWKNQCDCVAIDNEKETTIKPDSLPIFIGGEGEMYRPLFDRITPSQEIIRQGKSGVVLIKVIIDEQGKIEVRSIYQGLEPNFDNAVLEGMKTIPNEFIPAKKANKPIKVRCFFQYTYKAG